MSDEQTTTESPALVKKVVESDEFKHALKKAVDRAVSDINAGDIDGMDSAVEDALSDVLEDKVQEVIVNGSFDISFNP